MKVKYLKNSHPLRKTVMFTTAEDMQEYRKKNQNKYQFTEIFVNNGYAWELKILKQIKFK